MSGDQRVVRVGTRKSQLAMVQTEKVIDSLSTKFPSIKFEILSMTTTGDKILDKPLPEIGEVSVFTKELEVALLEHRVDMIVHSLKDVPTELASGLVVGAICARNDSSDALVVKLGSTATSLDTLPTGSVVGTSSMRRTAQLSKLHPHLRIVDMRGNLNTRLAKLDDEEGGYDAMVLAHAGLARLGWHSRITQRLSPDTVMYAVGQGAMCVECRSDDLDTLQLLSHVNHPPTALVCLSERAFLRKLEGGCSVPVAVMCELEGDRLFLKGGVYSYNGKNCLEDSLSCTLEGFTDQLDVPKYAVDPTKHLTSVMVGGIAWPHQEAAFQLGISLAERLKERGANAILKEARAISKEREMLKKEVVK